MPAFLDHLGDSTSRTANPDQRELGIFQPGVFSQPGRKKKINIAEDVGGHLIPGVEHTGSIYRA